MKNSQALVINKIKYVQSKAVCVYANIKCCINELKHCHLTIRGVLTYVKFSSESELEVMRLILMPEKLKR